MGEENTASSTNVVSDDVPSPDADSHPSVCHDLSSPETSSPKGDKAVASTPAHSTPTGIPQSPYTDEAGVLSPSSTSDTPSEGNLLTRFQSWISIKKISFKAWKQGVKTLYGQLKELFQGKHRFAVMDTQTYREKFSFQLSGISVFVAVSVIMLLLIILTTVIIVFTPLREFIPGYANAELIEQSSRNTVIIDSLQQHVRYQEWMIRNIQDVIAGNPMTTAQEAKHKSDSLAALGVSPTTYMRSRDDSLLRIYVRDNDGNYEVRLAPRVSTITPKYDNSRLAHGLFFTPMQGQVIAPFDIQLRHYGVDVAGVTNAPISAIYGGTVVFANFTVETGYTIAIQHADNIISLYKHCSTLLKKEGDVVLVGEPIAYLGNTGSLTTGPHLHFEIWMAGNPVDPVQYVRF